MHWLECHQQYTLNQLTAPTLIDLKIIHEEVEQELRLKEIIQKLQEGEEVNNYSMQHGMLQYKERIVTAKPLHWYLLFYTHTTILSSEDTRDS